MDIKKGQKWNANESGCFITEVFNPKNSNLNWLSLAEMELFGVSSSPELCFKKEEVLIFNLKEEVIVYIDDMQYTLNHYDVLYIPIDTPFWIEQKEEDEAWLYLYRATGEVKYDVWHSKWSEMKKNKERIRYLNKKEVYLMFDVAEKANKFMAGYTFYESETRAWPPHNHTDQEECYSFIEGSGAMAVYEKDDEMTFVKSVEIGDHITIPLMTYHPVFSHEEPLCFIWCIAGERYWVGDKNKDFMDAK
ncbi:MAG: 5-deoxy-glucuronate isomerase, partial [Spirochaetes bacterium]|nr:5-deoxy-glucuronate isomerase [Spirochaetota bacterium]